MCYNSSINMYIENITMKHLMNLEWREKEKEKMYE